MSCFFVVTFVSAKFGTLPVLVLFSSPLLSFSLPRVRLSVSCISKKDFLFPLALRCCCGIWIPKSPFLFSQKAKKMSAFISFLHAHFLGGHIWAGFVCPVCANLWGIKVHVDARQMLTTHRDIANVCYPYVKRKKNFEPPSPELYNRNLFAMHHLGWFPYQEVELIYT